MTAVAVLLGYSSISPLACLAGGIGFPAPNAENTLRADFKAPPPGYGEIPFWWWSGPDPLDRDRLLEQIEELHKAGIAGVQVNYAHYRNGVRPTQDSTPRLFSDEWWEIFGFVASECAKRKMGISLSNYTLDFPEGKNLWTRLGISTPDVRAKELTMRTMSFKGGRIPAFSTNTVAVIAAAGDSRSASHGRALVVDPQKGGDLPAGNWTLYSFNATPKPRTLDPLNAESGRRVVERFFNPFIERVPESARSALNYFFQDELILSRNILWMWSADFAAEFRRRKGYDIVPMLPALFTDWGPDTVKVRLDMNDVMSTLASERYYKPIYDWHASRGLIYGCDQALRGKHPMHKYIDYMRVMKYFTAPGFDTPGRSADIIKNKVGSSIAHLYRRPRVWLEGYHSQGWQASTSTIFDSTCHNYLYGSNLLNLHGLYYSTYGGWWEWAPPCYHFRMPYWKYMKTFLKYFERLSYILSQGVHVCDVAVVNPLEPCVYNRNRGRRSVGVSHDIVRRLVSTAQTDVDFIDADSIVRATVENGRLCVAGEAYKVVVVPDMIAIRMSTLEKLCRFKRAGGVVAVLGEEPRFTDVRHQDKAKADALIAELTADKSTLFPANPSAENIKAIAAGAGVPDFRGPGSAKAMHRRIGGYDVYFICDLKEKGECVFRADGVPELWDPWDGSQKALDGFRRNADGTVSVRIPCDGNPRLVVFSADGASHERIHAPLARKTEASGMVLAELSGTWDFALEPTMDNKWGDFRLPVRERFIGAEIRQVKMEGAKDLGLPERMTVSYGPQFMDAQQSPFLFSWREGAEGMPGFQDWHHGLNGIVGDDFFVLGQYSRSLYGVSGPDRSGGSRNAGDEKRNGGNRTEGAAAVWDYETFVYAPCDCRAKPVSHGVEPCVLQVDGRDCAVGKEISLAAGYHRLRLRYGRHGRAALVMMRTDVASVPSKIPLSMRWYGDPAVLPFDPYGGRVKEGIYSATLAPACEQIEMRIRGTVLAADAGGSGADVILVEKCTSGEKVYRIKPRVVHKGIVEFSVKVAHEPGFIGGAVFTEPLRLSCGKGVIALGDWAMLADGLKCYSGGAVYEKSFALTAGQAEAARTLDLGDVGVCCGVSVNGAEEKVLCCPPWRIDVSGMVKEGKNTVRVNVYNTLNNHYQTIPTRYRTAVMNAPSGIIGPVKVLQ